MPIGHWKKAMIKLQTAFAEKAKDLAHGMDLSRKQTFL